MEKFQTKKGVPVCVNFYTFMFHFELLFPHGQFCFVCSAPTLLS